MNVSPRKIKVHIVGTHGVPANYGGFETLADHLCRELGNSYDLTVYCSSKKYSEKKSDYFGAKLVYVSLGASGFSGIFYDIITYFRAIRKADLVLYLGPTGSGFLLSFRFLSRTKVVVNHGGLNEWERDKLSWLQKRWARFNHRIAAKRSSANVADNDLYRQSLYEHFKADSTVIRYGGDHVQEVSKELYLDRYPFLASFYALSVSRAQVDNNLHLLLECFSSFEDYPLVLISNWEVSNYGRELKTKYTGQPNLILLDAIYDQTELDCLRGNAHVYIHSHSYCGTAPSLIEAMTLGRPIISFDAGTNRETTEGKVPYFNDVSSLKRCLEETSETELIENGLLMKKMASEKYQWKHVARAYAQLFEKLLDSTSLP